MNFFSDDHAAELRELFFESATELLQTLNEEGLELEKRPEDEEVLRQVRRTVHTLKGDSAACGYTELSELAHELEDVLRPDIAAMSKAALARSCTDCRRYIQFHALRVSGQPATAGRRRAERADHLAYQKAGQYGAFQVAGALCLERIRADGYSGRPGPRRNRLQRGVLH